MSKSPNINLELTPAAEGDKNFQTWRTELAGEDSSSNMMILDTEIGQIKAGYLPTSQKGTPGGVASLDAAGKVPSGQLPAMDYDPAGSAAAVQAELDTHEADKSNPHSVTKTQVGLGNVDNTSDANKPVSTAVQTALDAKADKAVPSAANNVALLDASGNLADSGKALTPAAIGALPAGGTAAAAEKLATVRTIQVNLASTTAANFDGTGNVTPGVTGTLPVALGGTGATTAAAALSNLGAQSKLLSDDTASALGLSGDPTVDDALKASAGKVGDIKITTRTDLGNDWLLCNGAGISSDDYPELTPMLPKELNNVNVETQTTGIPSSASIQTFTIENNKLFIITHEDSNYYIYSCDIGKNNWVKSNTAIFSGNITPGAFSFVSYANGYYYASVDSRSRPESTSASITFPNIYRSSDLVNWSACTVTLVFSQQLTTWNSGVFLYVGTIKYNSTTQKYCVPISFYDWSVTSTSCKFIMPIGTINGSNITVTTDRIRANSMSYFTNATYLDKTYFFRGLTTIGNYFVLPEYDTSRNCNGLFMSDSSATISVEKSVQLTNNSTYYYNYAALACEIDGNIAVITNGGVFKVTGEYGSMTSTVNINLSIESTHSVTGIYHDAANKTIYVILRNENTIKKYVYNNIFTDTGFVSTESKPINEETSVAPEFRGVTPSGWCYVMSYAPRDVKVMSPAESYMLPTIDVDKAYAYIKGR